MTTEKSLHPSQPTAIKTIQAVQNTPQRQRILKSLRNRPSTKGCLAVLSLLIIAVLIAPFFAPQDP